jgi:hypothetical protein
VSFLAPWWIALAASAVVPILLHRWRRRHGAPVPFPALRYLLAAEQERRQDVAWRHRLLLALRIALLLGLALAAARPVARLALGGHAPMALAIVLDNSLSSAAAPQGAPQLGRLAAAAQGLLDASAATDRLWLVTVGGEVLTGRAAAEAWLARPQALTGGGDPAAAVRRAEALVRSAGPRPSHVVLVTDGQAQTLAALPPAEVPRTLLVPPARPLLNRGLLAVRPEPTRWGRGAGGTLRVSVRSPDSTDLRVVLAERTVARATLPPDGAAALRVLAPDTGWVAGHVDLPPDALRGDDRRHFAVRVAPPPGLGAEGAGPFAAAALAALVEAGRAQAGAEVLLRPAAGYRGGRALLLGPSGPSEVAAANASLAAAGIPWRFAALRSDSFTVREGPLAGVQVRRHHPLQAVAEASADSVLVRVGGAPWAVASGGVVLLGSPLDTAATSLPLRAAFVPWLGGLLDAQLAPSAGPVLDAAPAAPFTPPAGVDALRAAAGGAPLPLSGGAARAPAVPGVYWLLAGGAVRGALVVDPEPGESDLPGASPVWPDTTAGALVTTPETAATRIFTGDGPRALLGPLLLLLLLLFLVEGWVARPPRTVPA